jgi:lysozyme
MKASFEKDVLNIAVPMIAKFEGMMLKAYPDPATGGEPWTIGYGATHYADGTKVRQGDEISKEEAETLLRLLVGNFMHKVLALVDVELTAHQAAALTSLAYNIGLGNFRKSTLLKKLNAGDKAGAAREFLKWNHAGHKVLAGLTRRREAESQEFLT